MTVKKVINSFKRSKNFEFIELLDNKYYIFKELKKGFYFVIVDLKNRYSISKEEPTLLDIYKTILCHKTGIFIEFVS